MELSRMFWRCEAGLLRGEVVKERLDRELADLVHRYRSQQPSWQPLARAGSREIQICLQIDGCIDAVHGALVANELRSAWQNLREAGQAWERLLSAVQADAGLGQARAIRERIEAAGGSDLPVASFETYRVVASLVARAESLFQAGEYRQARFVAAMCVSHVDASLPASRSGVAPDLPERLAKLRALETQLAADVPWSGGGISIGHGVAAVEALDSTGHRALAEHLVGDLEVLVEPRVAFLSHLQRMRTREADVSDRSGTRLLERSGIGAQDSWSAATEKLLYADLERLAANLAAIELEAGPETVDRSAMS